VEFKSHDQFLVTIMRLIEYICILTIVQSSRPPKTAVDQTMNAYGIGIGEDSWRSLPKHVETQQRVTGGIGGVKVPQPSNVLPIGIREVLPGVIKLVRRGAQHHTEQVEFVGKWLKELSQSYNDESEIVEKLYLLKWLVKLRWKLSDAEVDDLFGEAISQFARKNV
jgi:hypothetical protein